MSEETNVFPLRAILTRFEEAANCVNVPPEELHRTLKQLDTMAHLLVDQAASNPDGAVIGTMMSTMLVAHRLGLSLERTLSAATLVWEATNEWLDGTERTE